MKLIDAPKKGKTGRLCIAVHATQEIVDSEIGHQEGEEGCHHIQMIMAGGEKER